MAEQGSTGFSAFVSLPGLSSVGLACIAYLASRRQDGKLEQLNSVRDCGSVQDLLRLKSMALPALVALYGRINSDNPIRCELSPERSAVLQEVVEEEIWRKERENGRPVHEPFEVRKVQNQCEWFLEPATPSPGHSPGQPSAPRVRVANVTSAERLASTMETKVVFVPEDISRTSIAKLIIDKAWQMSKQGVRRTERFLPVGTSVTVVGELDGTRAFPGAPTTVGLQLSEASTSGAGSGIAKLGAAAGAVGEALLPLVLRRPACGPFYITPLTLEQLKASLAVAARGWRLAAIGLGGLGCILLLRKALARLLQLHRQERIRRRVAEADAQRKQRLAAMRAAQQPGLASAASAGDNQEEPEDGDRQPDMCVVCLEGSCEMVFTQCGHLCCCFRCGHQLQRCPICRTRGAAIKVFRP